MIKPKIQPKTAQYFWNRKQSPPVVEMDTKPLKFIVKIKPPQSESHSLPLKAIKDKKSIKFDMIET